MTQKYKEYFGYTFHCVAIYLIILTHNNVIDTETYSLMQFSRLRPFRKINNGKVGETTATKVHAKIVIMIRD